MGEKIRVLIVDDHALFAVASNRSLQRHQEFEVVDVAGDGLEGVKRAKFLKPDVVLLDLNMPEFPARRLAPHRRGGAGNPCPDADRFRGCGRPHGDPAMSARQGYLVKNIETEALVDAIRRAGGESVYHRR